MMQPRLNSSAVWLFAFFLLISLNSYGSSEAPKGSNDVAQKEHVRLINGHRFVDLGLPSGLLWAETNLGADNPEDAGNYYAWGETGTKLTYVEGNSKWYQVTRTDNLTAANDAATANWGRGVRMPTSEEFSELLNSANCRWTWTTLNGKTGYQVTSNLNGCKIFLPAAGHRYGDGLFRYGEFGSYWPSTPHSRYNFSYCLCFYSEFYSLYGFDRYFGRSVRPVAE